MEKNAAKMARTDKWKVPEPGIDDRLTSLPDEIISHILSFLPTKYAVGTAVLSRRWKDLWTRVSNLDFDNRLVYRDLISSRVANYFRLTEMEDRRRDVEFLRFVDRVFSQHRNLDSVRCFRFHVSVSRAMQDYLNKRGLAFGSQVEEIDVLLLEAIVSQLCLQLPESFYTLKNLKVAKLHEVKATVNGSVSLPSLKILELWDVLAEDRESLSRLITGCPILETLRLEHCILLDMNENDVLIASIPSLRNLTIIAFLAEDDDKCLCRIAMEAPKLEHLYLEDFTELEFLCSSSPLPCLDSARVDTGRRASSYQSLVRLLAQISSAKEMCLYWNTLEFLSAGDNIQLAVFPNLTYLTLEPTERSSSWILHSLLHSVPRLQSLVIKPRMAEGSMLWEETEPTCTPQCVQSSLEEIEVKDFVPLKTDIETVAHLLTVGAVLKKVDIHVVKADTKQERKELQVLLRLPRVSSTCDVRIFLCDSEIDIDIDDGGEINADIQDEVDMDDEV